MSKNVFQVIFPPSDKSENLINKRFHADAKVMRSIGIKVGTKPLKNATKLMYKGFCINNKNDYPSDGRFINTFKENILYTNLSYYYPVIADLSIETFFVDDLDDLAEKIIIAKGWESVFVKKDSRALEHIEEGKSVWPLTSFSEMKRLYNEFPFEGKYAIRKFIDKDIIEQEERYWVFNGNIYHRTNVIPDLVREAAKRLDKLGSKYYTIDATPEFIVEVNPGESSDRHAVNSAELFASWIKKEFMP